MMRIFYANTEVLTGDAIALAVLHYSEALGESGLAETIEIPIQELDGSRGTAILLVGPASQIVATRTTTEFGELEDTDTVDDLRVKTQRLRPLIHTDAEPPERIPWAEDL
ncbi:hypothetical protein ACLQ2Q_17830 [Microbacterium sp. DT81.1]|uniref:hypothetical protein n=1 Tax=Microbacterium sp. DT81.1 TaxID=3393413 RepID=UPI003CFACCBD